jgi:hypothetical protein
LRALQRRGWRLARSGVSSIEKRQRREARKQQALAHRIGGGVKRKCVAAIGGRLTAGEGDGGIMANDEMAEISGRSRYRLLAPRHSAAPLRQHQQTAKAASAAYLRIVMARLQ